MKFVLCFLLTIGNVWGKEHAPALIWGNYDSSGQSASVPGLSKIGAFEFAQFLHRLVTHRPHVILFTEHNLSTEDLSWRDGGDTCSFPYLRNLSQRSQGFIYLPSVEAPVTVLHQLTHHGYSFAKYEEESPPNLTSPTILTVVLREPGAEEPRQAFLQSHDEEMARISHEAIDKYGKVLVIYTGRHASFIAPNRHKREVETEDTGPGEIVMSDIEKMIIVVTASPILLRNGNNITNLTKVTFSSKEFDKKPNVILDVAFKDPSTQEKISLDLVFHSPTDNQAWTLEAIKLEGKGVEMRSRRPIGAPAGYSFFCAQDVVFSGTGPDGESFSLTFKGIQAQPRVSNNAFGPASDCIPYFSEPIWSGLLVLLLLVSVSFMAILFILDIRTMDKFDDPKGKVLTITNTE